MTVAFDAFTYRDNSFNASDSFTHTPVGTPKGVIAYIINANDDATTYTVTYGGVSLTLVGTAASTALNSDVHCFFLGAGIPTGAQTVSVVQTGSSSNSRISVYTVTAATDTEVVDSGIIDEESNTTDPSATLSTGSRNTFASQVINGGGTVSMRTNWTADQIFVTEYIWASYDIVGTSDVTFGWNVTSNTGISFATAVGEVESVTGMLIRPPARHHFKPPAVEIDYSWEWSQKLFALFDMGAQPNGGIKELITGRTLAAPYHKPVNTIGTLGYGTRWDASAGPNPAIGQGTYFTYTPTTEQVMGTKDFWCLCITRYEDVAEQTFGYFISTGGYKNTSSFAIYAHYSTAPPEHSWWMGADGNTSDPDVPTGTPAASMVYRSAGRNGVHVVNAVTGIQVNTQDIAVGGGNDNLSSTSWVIGHRGDEPGDNRFYEGEMYMIAMGYGTTTAAERDYICRNWKKFFKPQESSVLIFGSAAAGGGPTAYFQTVAGILAPAGAITKGIAVSYAGSLSPAGAVTKQAQKVLAGSVTPTSTLSTRALVAASLAGQLTPAGSMVKKTMKAVVGALTPSGAVTKQTQKTVAGAVSPEGAVIKETQKVVAGSITPTGAVASASAFSIAVAGVLNLAGALATLFIAFVAPAAITYYRRTVNVIRGLGHNKRG